jgi:hypothetical protein
VSQVRDLFRICPACGRRFHIKLVDRELTGERREVETLKRGAAAPTAPSSMSMGVITLEVDVPVTIDVKDFQYTYKCKHCGHVWSEQREEESKA